MVDDRLLHIKEFISYEPDTGLFRWLVKRRSPKDVGRVAGVVGRDGYVQITLFNKTYKAHRLAWFIVHGSFPSFDIDHIDGDRTNNRLVNLRDVPRVENLQNRRLPLKKNKTGLLGVSPNHKRFSASIKVNGAKKHLGTFDTPLEAHHAYMAAKVILHPGYVQL